MPTVVLDSNVLIAARNDDADNHDIAKKILDGIDRGTLPEARITNYVVAEVLNLLHGRHSHGIAIDTYERLDRGVCFRLDHETEDDFDALDSVARLRTDSNPFGP